jgi:hypothetical protein
MMQRPHAEAPSPRYRRSHTAAATFALRLEGRYRVVTEQLRDPGGTQFPSRDQDLIRVSLSLDKQIPAHLRPVVRELMLGAVDAAACRRLNVSPRTFSRRVAELLDQLGVESRFQAGMEIMLRQLLPAGRQPELAGADRHADHLHEVPLPSPVERRRRASDMVNGIG